MRAGSAVKRPRPGAQGRRSLELELTGIMRVFVGRLITMNLIVDKDLDSAKNRLDNTSKMTLFVL